MAKPIDQLYAELAQTLTQLNAPARPALGNLGGLDQSGVYQLEVARKISTVYAHTSANPSIQALNLGVPLVPECPVLIFTSGNVSWVQVDPVRLPDFIASGGQISAVPPHSHDDPANGLYDLVSSHRINAGGLLYLKGGLLVACTSHWYWNAAGDQLVLFDGPLSDGAPLNLTVDAPTSGNGRWVVVCVDKTNNVLSPVDGPLLSLTRQKRPSDIGNIVIPTDFEPKMTVWLYGQTAITWADLEDPRPWLGQRGGGTGGGSIAVTDGTTTVDPTTLLDFDPTYFDVTDLTGGEAGVSFLPSSLTETIQDIIGAALVAGTNITITYNDPAGTMTIAAGATPGGGAPPSICEGRLTLTTGVPVTTSDVTAATTLYWSPYKGGYVGVYSGSAWVLFVPGELNISLSGLLPHSIHDVFINYNSGTPALEFTAWSAGPTGTITGVTNASPPVVTSNAHGLGVGDIVTISGLVGSTGANGHWRISAVTANTFTLVTLAGANPGAPGAYTSGGTWYKSNYNGTRATALITQNGILVKTGATTRRYLGTIRITEVAGQIDDSDVRRFVWNYYNPARKRLFKVAPADHTYATSAYRVYANDFASRLELVEGLAERALTLTITQRASGGTAMIVGIGEDSLTTPTDVAYAVRNTNIDAALMGTLNRVPAVGYHAYYRLQYGSATVTFLQDASAVQGVWEC